MIIPVDGLTRLFPELNIYYEHYFLVNKSPLCGVAKTPDRGISFKALSVMSPRRPTVAFLLKTFL